MGFGANRHFKRKFTLAPLFLLTLSVTLTPPLLGAIL